MLGIASFQQVNFHSVGNPIITDSIPILVIVGYDNSYLFLFHFLSGMIPISLSVTNTCQHASNVVGDLAFFSVEQHNMVVMS